MNSTPPNFRTVPGATYRLQFSTDFQLSRAIGILDYLRELGITTVYASPLFQAGPESTHGYDVCSFSEINSKIGNGESFDRFASELKRLGLSLIIDMVPNHMRAALSNGWWLDVLENGRHSKYAPFFDINWEPQNPMLKNKVLLPLLEDDYGKVLESGKLQLGFAEGKFFLGYQDRKFPISQTTLPSDAAKQISATLREFNGTAGNLRSFDKLHDLIQRQHYRLACWRNGSEQINYRRFFDVTELVSLRMDRPEVFDATHELIFDWIRSGKLSGLRIDHPDGLHNPKQYLERLQSRAAELAGVSLTETLPQSDRHETCVSPDQCLQPAQPLYVVVEKILSGDETLPSDWPVAGTTGYDFLNRVSGLFVKAQNAAKLDAVYNGFIADDCSAETDFNSLVRRSKRKVLEASFVSELNSLTLLLEGVAALSRAGAGFTFSQLRTALADLIVSFPVYRTYLTEESLQPTAQERSVILKGIQNARTLSRLDPAIFEFLERILTLELLPELTGAGAEKAREFVMRFQQLTGPVMAKGLEDTAFYNFNRLISLNEVGGNPSEFGQGIEAFHNTNFETLARWPHTLLATATHDTKRGEDARARINVLSELPDEWNETATRWKQWNAGKKISVNGKSAPASNDEYLLYQSLVGALPPDSVNPDKLKSFRERTVQFMLKAIREAKANTSWAELHLAYETAVQEFTERLLTDSADNVFLDDVRTFCQRIAFFGRFNSLSQTLLKLTAPGVPDIYQGTELWDFSFVDPDNRRPVDFEMRKKLLAELHTQATNTLPDVATDQIGKAKLFVIWRALGLRNRLRPVFDSGDYTPLPAFGSHKEHVCAFARAHERFRCITVAPRLIAGLMGGRQIAPVGEAIWDDTIISLPNSSPGDQFRDAFTQEIVSVQEHDDIRFIRLSHVLKRFPVAQLEQIKL